MKAEAEFERARSAAGESGTNFRPSADVVLALGLDPVGLVLDGKYRVERVIGQGAMGVVLSARHLELDEIVAIKFIHPRMQRVPGVVSRFAREAKASARVKCEHIAAVLDVGVTQPIGPYIVMEFLEGETLAALVARRGPLPLLRAVEYAMQVCEALAFAHAKSITHRDIKSENLFLTRRGDADIVKVLDFGISKAVLTGRVFGDEFSPMETSGMLGTPLYMSPEQIRATSDVDHRSDIWSLGCVLYELVSGRTAFGGDSVTQVCAMVLESRPAPLAAHGCQAPAEFQAVVDRCLEKDPARRFQSTAELANALLPFAPSRARLHAERASSLGIPGAARGAARKEDADSAPGSATPVDGTVRMPAHSSAPSDGALLSQGGRVPALAPDGSGSFPSATGRRRWLAYAGALAALLALGFGSVALGLGADSPAVPESASTPPPKRALVAPEPNAVPDVAPVSSAAATPAEARERALPARRTEPVRVRATATRPARWGRGPNNQQDGGRGPNNQQDRRKLAPSDALEPRGAPSEADSAPAPTATSFAAAAQRADRSTELRRRARLLEEQKRVRLLE